MHSDKKPTDLVTEKIKEGKSWRSGVDHITSTCKVLGSVSSKVINNIVIIIAINVLLIHINKYNQYN